MNEEMIKFNEICETIESLKLENEKLNERVSLLEEKLSLLENSTENNRGAGRKNIPESVQKQIIQKRKEGAKIKDLMEEYSLSSATVNTILKKEKEFINIIEEPVAFFEENKYETLADFLNTSFFD